MRSVHVAELKNRLSHYLATVRAGHEIVVRNRQMPIARIIPFSGTGDLDTQESALAAAAKLRPGSGSISASFWSMPAPRVSMKRIRAAIDAERRED